MALLQAAILGVVQGLTEFLPVSSTAHLILVPWLMGWRSPGLAFDVALHLGTLLAVIWYFRQDLATLMRALPRAVAKRDFVLDPDHRLLGQLALGILPAGLVGFLLDDWVETTLRDPRIIGVMLIGIGLLLAWADRRSSHKQIHDLTYPMAIGIGLAQALALVPGVSRSGITMAAALAMGLQREGSARFSFLLGLPIIAAGGLFHLKDMVALPTSEMAYFGVGVLAAASSGYLCIRYFLRYLRRSTFTPFVIYRVLLGIFVLAVATQLA